MAKMLMGMIATKMAGKLNGHCLRNIAGNQVVGRLALQSKNYSINKNQAMTVIRNVFRSWGNVSAEDKALWNYWAGLNPVLDRWGNPKYLSGRQLFSSCNINAQEAGFATVNVSTFSSAIPEFSIPDFDFNITEEIAHFKDAVFQGGLSVQVNCQVVQNGYINIDPKKIKRVVYWNSDAGEDYDFFKAMQDAGFNFVAGRYYAFSFRVISQWGYCSPYYYFNKLGE